MKRENEEIRFFEEGIAQLTKDWDATKENEISWTDWKETEHCSHMVIIHFEDNTEIRIDIWKVNKK